MTTTFPHYRIFECFKWVSTDTAGKIHYFARSAGVCFILRNAGYRVKLEKKIQICIFTFRQPNLFFLDGFFRALELHVQSRDKPEIMKRMLRSNQLRNNNWQEKLLNQEVYSNFVRYHSLFTPQDLLFGIGENLTMASSLVIFCVVMLLVPCIYHFCIRFPPCFLRWPRRDSAI